MVEDVRRGGGAAAHAARGRQHAGDRHRAAQTAPHLDDYHVVERISRHAARQVHFRRRHRIRRGRAHRALQRERRERAARRRIGARPARGGGPVAVRQAQRGDFPAHRRPVRRQGRPRHRAHGLGGEEARRAALPLLRPGQERDAGDHVHHRHRQAGRGARRRCAKPKRSRC